MKRRDFLKACSLGASTGVLLSLSPALFALSEQKKGTILYSAGSDLEGRYNISAVFSNEKGQGAKHLFSTPLPARAHAVTVRKRHHEIVVFARRPDDFMLVLDAHTGVIKQKIINNHPLFGHGVFSPDGKKLFTTENDYENKIGVIGVRDASDGYKKIGEFPSGGIGPHELHLLADGKTLVVANGGILTHPDTGRSKLNLDSMTPALTYIDTQSEKVIADYRLDKKHHQLSIRHLDVTQEDHVCFVMQYQGSRRHQVPLIGFHRGESSLQLAKTPADILPQMKNYCGSVTADASGQIFAVSSPRGNLITLWSRRGKFIESFSLEDGCGIANTRQEGEFFFSNGQGDLHQYSTTTNALLSSNQHQRWDNHLTAWSL